jgi:uncharacterized protein
MNESKNDRRIDYIEFRVRDIAKTKAFYGDVFGWRFKDYGPNYCEFQDGRLTGGFTTEGAPQPGGPLVVIYGDDLPALSQIIVKSGGRISSRPTTSPGDDASILSIPTDTSLLFGPRRGGRRSSSRSSAKISRKRRRSLKSSDAVRLLAVVLVTVGPLACQPKSGADRFLGTFRWRQLFGY